RCAPLHGVGLPEEGGGHLGVSLRRVELEQQRGHRAQALERLLGVDLQQLCVAIFWGHQLSTKALLSRAVTSSITTGSPSIACMLPDHMVRSLSRAGSRSRMLGAPLAATPAAPRSV